MIIVGVDMTKEEKIQEVMQMVRSLAWCARLSKEHEDMEEQANIGIASIESKLLELIQ